MIELFIYEPIEKKLLEFFRLNAIPVHGVSYRVKAGLAH